MIKRSILALSLIVYITGLMAQNKAITLEDAVLRQYSHFYPSATPGLQWVKGSDMISWFSDDYTAVIGKMVPSGKVDTLYKAEDLNKALGLELKTAKNPTWLDKDHFYFRNKKNYFKYDLTTHTGTEWLNIPNGQNMSFNQQEFRQD